MIGKPYCAIANQILALSAKRTGTQRRRKAVYGDVYIVRTVVGKMTRLRMKQPEGFIVERLSNKF